MSDVEVFLRVLLETFAGNSRLSLKLRVLVKTQFKVASLDRKTLQNKCHGSQILDSI